MEASIILNHACDPENLSPDDLLSAVRKLDRLLDEALVAAQASDGAETEETPFRGLYLDPLPLSDFLSRQEPVREDKTSAYVAGVSLYESREDYPSRLAWLAKEFDLSLFDLDLILLAFAPQCDLRYERVYAFLQDDVTRRRPSVELALKLFCSEVRPSDLIRFAHDAPLIRAGLLRPVAEPNQTDTPLLARYLQLDEQVLYFLLGHKSLDPRLDSFAQLSMAPARLEKLFIPEDSQHALRALVLRAQAANRPLQLYFRGQRGVGKRSAAEAVAGEIGAPLLAVNLCHITAQANECSEALSLVRLAARLHGAVIYMEGFDAPGKEEQEACRRHLKGFLQSNKGICILAGEGPPGALIDSPLEIINVPFPAQDFAARRMCWQENLKQLGMSPEASVLDALSSRFRLTQGEIACAVKLATQAAQWRAASMTPEGETGPADVYPKSSELFSSARAAASFNLSELANKIEPRYRWNDIILPPDQLSQLREICNQAAYQHLVYGEWGFDLSLSLGKGINVLFSGPPGVGKTMAAEIIANELQLALYKIDLSQVVSKYIGETEKNLHRIFQEARASSAILFFDEADALFGKRSEVKDAHDRYANIEVGYLLQKMEEYDGIAILATNLRHHMDEAFMRRMHFIIEIPFPDEENRRRIWEGIFPPQAPLAGNVDCQLLAQEIRLAGGNIKNIALAAAFYAASDGRVIRLSHIVQATRREYQKIGRSWDISATGAQIFSTISEEMDAR